MEEITYRAAREQDAAFIAMAVAEAVEYQVMEHAHEGCLDDDERALLAQLEAVCRCNDTLYSWQHTRLAINRAGVAVGALVAYPGDDYMECRARTFARLRSLITFDVSQMDAETRQGEYYLDSVAVLPQWRGKGIARRLIADAQKVARRMGLPAILACAPANTRAKRLYESLGFRAEEHMYIFGEDYLRMVSSSVTSS